MSDLTTLSDDQLIAQIKAAQQSQNVSAMQHTQAPAPSGFLLNDPAKSGGGTLQIQPGALIGAGPTFDTHIPTPEWLDQGLAGAGRGIQHTENSIGNLAGLVPNSAMTEQKRLDAPLLNTAAGGAGNLLGETAMTAPLGMGVTGLVGNAGKAGAALAANPISNAMMQGGAQGLLTADPGDRAHQATLGSLTGGTLATGGQLVSKLVNGLTKSPEAARLLQAGVQLTPGQLNPGGMINQTEQAAEHAWGVGPMIHSAQENAEQQYQAAIIQQAAAPGAKITPSHDLHAMLQQAQDSYAPLYDQAKNIPVKAAVMNGRQGVKLSALFDQAAQAPGTTDAGQKAARSFLNNELTRLPANPTSTDLLAVRSNIRAAARAAKLSNDTIAGDKAAIYQLADDHVTRALQSQLPASALAALQSADSKYGTYKIVENAVASSKDNIAGLTPQKLSQAVYNATADPAYARGAGGPLRDLATAGAKTFQTVVPPTGATLGTLGAGAALAYTHPAVAGTLGAAQLAATLTPTGRRLAAGTTGPQQSVQQLVQALQSRVPAPVLNAGSQLAQRGLTAAGMPVTQAALPNALAAALMMMSPTAQPHEQH